MDRIVYLNGRWLKEQDAKLSIFDRSILFADGIYEVTCFLDRKLLDFNGHMARLKNSLKKLDIKYNVDADALLNLHHEIISRNGLMHGVIYLQITRGVTERDFHYDNTVEPTFFMFTQTGAEKGLETVPQLRMISAPEGRWVHRDIKTIQLLYSSLAKTRAHNQGVHDAVYIEDGYITEATSSNLHIVDQNNTIITRPLDGTILPGITRAAILKLAQVNGIKIEERPFTLEETFAAREVFISSASTFAAPVIELDGRPISNGTPGPTTLQLRKLYIDQAERY